MELTSQKIVFFSPTRTTQKVLSAIAEETGITETNTIDLTLPDQPGSTELNQELVLIGAPVYAGRVAQEAANRLQYIKGSKTPAVIAVVYGNRDYEDALIELRDLATAAGFIPIAAAAFIGEHSFATEAKPVANGRPDANDLEVARSFGRSIRTKLSALESPDAAPVLEVPGNIPYKERKPGGGISPETTNDICTLCGSCADVCPTAAITVGETVETDTKKCILCCACIKECPSGARVMKVEGILKITDWLHENFNARRDPEIFI